MVSIYQTCDPQRTVLFGHTTTMKLGAAKGGDIAKSKFNLKNGKPAWMALDTGANHVNPNLSAVNLANLKITRQTTLRRIVGLRHLSHLNDIWVGFVNVEGGKCQKIARNLELRIAR